MHLGAVLWLCLLLIGNAAADCGIGMDASEYFSLPVWEELSLPFAVDSLATSQSKSRAEICSGSYKANNLYPVQCVGDSTTNENWDETTVVDEYTTAYLYVNNVNEEIELRYKNDQSQWALVVNAETESCLVDWTNVDTDVTSLLGANLVGEYGEREFVDLTAVDDAYALTADDCQNPFNDHIEVYSNRRVLTAGSCPFGYEGADCSEKTLCTVNSDGKACQNGGAITGFIADNNCACQCVTNAGGKALYNGPECQNAIACAIEDIVCQNSGTVDTNSFLKDGCTCDCDVGYSGDDCSSKDSCLTDKLDRTCVNGVPRHFIADNNCLGEENVCICDFGYTGDLCDTKEQCNDCDLCAPDCKNNGTVAAGFVLDGCQCDCSGTDYEGALCDTPKQCTTNSAGVACQNGGSATGLLIHNNCACECQEGYKGDSCQIKTSCASGDGEELNCGPNGNATGFLVNSDCACECECGYIFDASESPQCVAVTQCCESHAGNYEAYATCEHAACSSDTNAEPGNCDVCKEGYMKDASDGLCKAICTDVNRVGNGNAINCDVCKNDMDGDDICDEVDECASVTCQCYGGDPCPLTCVDTGNDNAVVNYQCRDSAGNDCGGNGFTGAKCDVCAAGSGWNGLSGADAECVACNASLLEYNTQTTHDAKCQEHSCNAKYGVVADTTAFDTSKENSNICEKCEYGKTSNEGDGSCAQVDCPTGEHWKLEGAFLTHLLYTASSNKDLWCANRQNPAFENFNNNVQVQAAKTGVYNDVAPNCTDFTDSGLGNVAPNIDPTVETTSAPTVNKNTIRDYTFEYKCTDAAGAYVTATRTVTVADTNKPILSVSGGSNVAYIDQAFDAPTVTCTDTFDDKPNITHNENTVLDITGGVVKKAPGNYAISYFCKDASDNEVGVSFNIKVMQEGCEENTCNGRGECSVEGLTVRCECEDKYGGDRCQNAATTCPAGYKKNDDGTECVVDRSGGISNNARNGAAKGSSKALFNIRQYLKDLLKSDASSYSSKKDLVKANRVIIDKEDLKTVTMGKIKRSISNVYRYMTPENKDVVVGDRTECHLDLGDTTNDALEVLDIQDDTNSWGVVCEGSDLQCMQTRTDSGFELQQWNSSSGDWDAADDVSVNNIKECGRHTIVVGSVEAICPVSTCGDGAESCEPSGDSYTCVCQTGYGLNTTSNQCQPLCDDANAVNYDSNIECGACKSGYMRDDAGVCTKVCENDLYKGYGVAINCGDCVDDMDNDGTCDANDMCHTVECQCYGDGCTSTHLKCIDLGDTYQCRDESNTTDCGGNGFTGATCSVCGVGSGWNGLDGDAAACVACNASLLEFNTQTSHDAQCQTHSCPAGQGFTTDSAAFNTSSNDNAGYCKPCGWGTTSPANDAVCAMVDCPVGQEWKDEVDFPTNLTYTDTSDTSLWCENKVAPVFATVSTIQVEAHKTEAYDNVDAPACTDTVSAGNGNVATEDQLKVSVITNIALPYKINRFQLTGADGDSNYIATFNGEDVIESVGVKMCENDRLDVIRNDDFSGHPFKLVIGDVDYDSAKSSSDTIANYGNPPVGTHTYICTLHRNMIGKIQVLPSTDEYCSVSLADVRKTRGEYRAKYTCEDAAGAVVTTERIIEIINAKASNFTLTRDVYSDTYEIQENGLLDPNFILAVSDECTVVNGFAVTYSRAFYEYVTEDSVYTYRAGVYIENFTTFDAGKYKIQHSCNHENTQIRIVQQVVDLVCQSDSDGDNVCDFQDACASVTCGASAYTCYDTGAGAENYQCKSSASDADCGVVGVIGKLCDECTAGYVSDGNGGCEEACPDNQERVNGVCMEKCATGLQRDDENTCCANPVSVTLYLDRWSGSKWELNYNGWNFNNGEDHGTLYLLSKDDSEERTIDGEVFEGGEYKSYKSSLCVVGAWWGPASGRFARTDLDGIHYMQRVKFGEEYIRRTNVEGGSEGDVIFSNCDDPKKSFQQRDGDYGCYCDVSNNWVGSTVCAPVIVDGTTLKKGSGWREPKGVVDLSSFDTVTKIHEYMFSNDKGITSVIFPDSLQVIDTRAFSECTGITGTLNLSNTALTTIKMEAFYKAGMENIIFPATFTTLGNDAFGYSSLKTLDLTGTQVTTITKFSFHYADQLESVTFPSTLTSVQENALYIDSNLVLDFSHVNQDVSFHSDAFFTHKIQTVKVQKSTGSDILNGLRRPSSAEIITVDCDVAAGSESDDAGGCYCDVANNWVGSTVCAPVRVGSETLLISGEWLSNQPILKKGDNWVNPEGAVDLSSFNIVALDSDLFKGASGVTSVTFPSTLKIIKGRAFQTTGISGELDLSGTALTELINSAFYDCNSLTSVKFPTTLEYIGAKVFWSSGLKKAYSGDGTGTDGHLDLSGLTSLTEIVDSAFEQCTGLTSVTFPSTLETIGRYVFRGTKITVVDLTLVSQDVTFTPLLSFGTDETSLTFEVSKDSGAQIHTKLEDNGYTTSAVITVDCNITGSESNGEGGCTTPCKSYETQNAAGECVCDNDMDNDGTCDEDDECSSVVCQCYGVVGCTSTHLKCFDLGDTYQCRDDANTTDCGNNGFTGKTCSVCAAGSGWNGLSGAGAECLACNVSLLEYNTQTSHDAQCQQHSCPAGEGFTTDSDAFNATTSNDGYCTTCKHGTTSPANDAVCAQVDCPTGQHWKEGADFPTNLTYTDASNTSLWCANRQIPVLAAASNIIVEAHKTNAYTDNTAPTCSDYTESGDGNVASATDMKVTVTADIPRLTKTSVFDVIGAASDFSNYTATLDGANVVEADGIELCEGDSLSVTRSTGFSGHPFKIVQGDRTWDKASCGICAIAVLNNDTGVVSEMSEGVYTYISKSDENMIGKITVLPLTHAKCQAEKSNMLRLPGVYTATYTCTDAAGATATESRTIEVKDTVFPEFVDNANPSSNYNVKDNGSGDSTFVAYASACTDDNGFDATYSYSISGGLSTLDDFKTAKAGAYTITHTCTDDNKNQKTHTQSVTVGCEKDMDSDGTCDFEDVCARITCAHSSIFTCFDTGGNPADYQCKINIVDDACSSTGFTGQLCNECAVGSGWNQKSDASIACEACVFPETSHQTGATDICTSQKCSAGRGVVTSGGDSTGNHTDLDHNTNCELCPYGKTSPEGDGNCAEVVCPGGYEQNQEKDWVYDVLYNSSNSAHVINTWCTDVINCGNDDECANGAKCTEVVGLTSQGYGYTCATGTRGFSGYLNDKCVDPKEEYTPSGSPTICVPKCDSGAWKHTGNTVSGHECKARAGADGKPLKDEIDKIKSKYATVTSKAGRKERKQKLREYVQDLRSAAEETRLKNATKPYEELKKYAMELTVDDINKTATKDKYEKLPGGSKLKMTVGFEGDSNIVVAVQPRKQKTDVRDVQRVVLATPTSSAVLGILDKDNIVKETVKFTGKGVDSGYDIYCHDGTSFATTPITKSEDEDVACPIARGEPVNRTFDVHSLEETTTACMDSNAENYLATATYHDQAMCCELVGCTEKQLSDAYTQFTVGSGCDAAIGVHTNDDDANCQTSQCEDYLTQIEDYYYGEGVCSAH